MIKMPKFKNLLVNLTILVVSVFVLALCMEIFLRIYNPFNLRLHGNKIVLPINKKFEYEGLGERVIHTKNSIGFRGPDVPKDFNDYLSIIVVGGSTSECMHISDGFTWPELLEKKLEGRFNKVWLNNAGIDGHSTYGHIMLMREYILKLNIRPKIILFHIGANDIGRKDLSDYDRKTLDKSKGPDSFRGFLWKVKYYTLRGEYLRALEQLALKSEIANTILNFTRQKMAHDQTKVTVGKIQALNVKALIGTIPEAQREADLAEYKRYLDSFSNRIQELITLSRENGIEPILISQPTIYGLDLESGKSDGADGMKYNEHYWNLYEMYNNVTREAAKKNNCFLVDLAREMPKNMEYFYRVMHYTKAGAGKVADIVYADLEPYLAEKYPAWLKN